MSEKDCIAKLDTLIEFFKNYNNMLDSIESALEVQLAA